MTARAPSLFLDPLHDPLIFRRKHEVLLLTLARILRARIATEIALLSLHYSTTGVIDLNDLNDALAPFDPSPGEPIDEGDGA